MKKLLTILACMALMLTLVACNSVDTDGENKGDEQLDDDTVEEKDVYENVDLEMFAQSLYNGIPADQLPFLGTMPLDSENFEMFAFIPYNENYKGIASEPMMGSIAHSVVVIETSSEEEAAKVAADMKANCDPRKWICVEAEKVDSFTNKNLAMLLMTSEDKFDAMSENFKKFDGKVVVEEAAAPEVTDEEIIDDEYVDVDMDEEVLTDDETFDEVETEDVVITLPEEDAEADVLPTMPDEDIVHLPSIEVEMPSVDVEVETPSVDAPVAEAPASESKLEAIMMSLYNGIPEDQLPMLGSMELNEENFEYFAFIPYNASYTAWVSEPMMGSIAHSIVVVETPSEEEAVKVASDMKANCDPRKWICVTAEKVEATSDGRYAILVMSAEDKVDTIIANFKAAA